MRYILFSAATFLLLSGCGTKKDSTAIVEQATEEKTVTLTPQQLKNAAVQTGKLERREVSSVLKLNGKIDVPPQNMVSHQRTVGRLLKNHAPTARHARNQGAR